MRTLLRDRRYLAFWLGQVTSVFGNGMAMVALPALLLPGRGASTYGLVLAVHSAAMGVLLLAGGVVADRSSRTAVMALADVLRAAGVLGYVLLGAHGPLWSLLGCAALSGFGVALYDPAHRAALPQLVPPELLQRANALDSATKRLGMGAGAALGGVVVAVLGSRPALLLDLATFGVSLTTLLWLRLPAVRTTEVTPGLRAAVHEAREGVREVRRRPWAAVVMLQGTVQVFCLFAPAYALVPVVSLDRYGQGAYGWITATTFVGIVCGSLLSGRTRPRRRGLAAMNALAPSVLLPLCLAVDVPLWAFCLASWLAWTGIGWFAVLWFSSLQQEFAPEVQGRVFSLDSLATFGLEPIALALAPLVAARAGMTPVAIVAAVVMLVSTYVVLLVPGVAHFSSGSAGSTEPVAAPLAEPVAEPLAEPVDDVAVRTGEPQPRP